MKELAQDKVRRMIEEGQSILDITHKKNLVCNVKQEFHYINIKFEPGDRVVVTSGAYNTLLFQEYKEYKTENPLEGIYSILNREGVEFKDDSEFLKYFEVLPEESDRISEINRRLSVLRHNYACDRNITEHEIEYNKEDVPKLILAFGALAAFVGFMVAFVLCDFGSESSVELCAGGYMLYVAAVITSCMYLHRRVDKLAEKMKKDMYQNDCDFVHKVLDLKNDGDAQLARIEMLRKADNKKLNFSENIHRYEDTLIERGQ